MKSRLTKTAILIILLSCLSGCQYTGSIFGAGDNLSYPSQFIIGDTYILKGNEIINGDIAGIGTTLIIEEGALISGDISLVGSTLDMAGQLEGDMNVFAGTSSVQDSAVIQENINQIFHQTFISPNARILGEVNTYTFPNVAGRNIGEGVIDIIDWLRPANWLLFLLVRLVVFALLALMAIALFPEPTKRVIANIRGNLVPAWGVGIICLITVPFVSIILIITICLSPVGIILLFLLCIGYIWGWISLSFIFGHRLLSWLGLDPSKEITMAAGACCLTLLTLPLTFIPIVGFLLNLMISSVGLGGVVFSRFGTHPQ